MADIDDRQYSELSMADRMAIDQQLDRRDRQLLRQQGRIPTAFLGGIITVNILDNIIFYSIFLLIIESSLFLLVSFWNLFFILSLDDIINPFIWMSTFIDEDEDMLARMPRRRRHRAGAGGMMGLGDDGEDDDLDALDPNFALEDLKGRTVAEWLAMDQPRRHAAHKFRQFLSEYREAAAGMNVYF